jgi:hypothetical protein
MQIFLAVIEGRMKKNSIRVLSAVLRQKRRPLLKNLDAKSHPASLKSMDWIPIKLLERFKILFISNARRCVLLASRIVQSRPPSHTYAALAPLPADDADVRSDVAALGTSADRTDTVLGKDQ